MIDVQEAYQAARRQIDSVLHTGDTPKRKYFVLTQVQIDNAIRIAQKLTGRKIVLGLSAFFEIVLADEGKKELITVDFSDWPERSDIEFRSCPRLWAASIGFDARRSAIEWAGAIAAQISGCIQAGKIAEISGLLDEGLPVDSKRVDDWLKAATDGLAKDFDLPLFIDDARRLWDILEKEAEIYFKPQDTSNEMSSLDDASSPKPKKQIERKYDNVKTCTLKQFIEKNCELPGGAGIESKVDLIYKAGRKKPKLLKPIGDWKSGQTKIFYEDDLRGIWPSLTKEIPTLFPLKQHTTKE